MSRSVALSGSRLDLKLKPDRRGKISPVAGVYAITSPSGKAYIGSSSDIKKRRKSHRLLLEGGKHHSLALQRAWEKYKGRLRFKVLLICSVKHLIFYEQRAIDRLKPIYNMSRNAGTRLGSKVGEEGRKNMSAALRGNSYALGLKHTEETRRVISELHKGKPKSSEHRAKIAAALRGIPWCLGRKHSEETKEKMSRSAKLRWARTPKQKQSEEANERRRLSLIRYWAGRKKIVSDETRERMSRSAIRRCEREKAA